MWYSVRCKMGRLRKRERPQGKQNQWGKDNEEYCSECGWRPGLGCSESEALSS